MKESLLLDDNNRYSFLPIVPGRESIIQSYRNQQASFWIASQVDMSEDKTHWREGILYPNTTDKDRIIMNENAKLFITQVLAFFSGSDILVVKNLDENFIDEMKWLEVKAAYGFQSMMEMVHSEAYALQIDTLVSSSVEKEKLFNAIEHIPCVAKKADFVYKYMDREKSLAIRLIAFCCIEGILFSGEFCAIFWLKSLNRMPGLSRYNDLISKDENMHTELGYLLYTKYIKNKLSEIEVHDIIKSAVDVEIEFITEAIPCSMIGMNKKDMADYIKFVSNSLCLNLGYNKIYSKISNPFSFMNKISLELKQNFFEGKPTNYNIAISTDPTKNSYSEDAEF